MIDFIAFTLFMGMLTRMVSVPFQDKRVLNVSKACHKRVETCRKRVNPYKNSPFRPHEVRRRIRD